MKLITLPILLLIHFNFKCLLSNPLFPLCYPQMKTKKYRWLCKGRCRRSRPTSSSKGTEEHNSAAENVWKELPSFYTQTAYVFTTNVVIYRLIFSHYVWVRISFHLYFIVEALSTWRHPRPWSIISPCTKGHDLQMPSIEVEQDVSFRPG